jgi:hypothetical protein
MWRRTLAVRPAEPARERSAMRYRIFTLLCAASLLAALILAYLLGLRLFGADVAVRTPVLSIGSKKVMLGFGEGSILLVVETPLQLPPMRPWQADAPVEAGTWVKSKRGNVQRSEWLGFYYASGEWFSFRAAKGPPPTTQPAIVVFDYARGQGFGAPAWALLAVTLILPALWLSRARKARARARAMAKDRRAH